MHPQDMSKIHHLIPPTFHHLAFPNSGDSRSSDPAAQGRHPGVIPEATPVLAANIPSILLALLATFLTSIYQKIDYVSPHLHSHSHRLHATSFPLLCTLHLLFFTCPLSVLDGVIRNGPGSICDLTISLLKIPPLSCVRGFESRLVRMSNGEHLCLDPTFAICVTCQVYQCL